MMVLWWFSYLTGSKIWMGMLTEWISGGETATFTHYIALTPALERRWRTYHRYRVLRCTRLCVFWSENNSGLDARDRVFWSENNSGLMNLPPCIKCLRMFEYFNTATENTHFSACSSSTFGKRYQWSNVLYTYQVGNIIQGFILPASRTHVWLWRWLVTIHVINNSCRYEASKDSGR